MPEILLAQIIVAALVVGFGITVIRFGLRGVKALWAKVGGLFGGTTELRLFAFALASLHEPYLIPSIIRTVFTFVLELVVLLPLSLFQADAIPEHKAGEGWSAFPTTLYGFLRGSASRLHGAFRSLEDLLLPGVLTDLLIICALAAVIGRAFTMVQPTNGSAQKTWLRSWYESLSTSARQHLTLAAVLLFGAFLSLASIVTIPFLEQPATASALTDKALENDLAGKSIPADLVGWVPGEDPLEAIITQLKALPAPASDGGTDTRDSAELPAPVALFSVGLQQQQEARRQLVASWSSLSKRVQGSREEAVRAVLTKFRTDSANRPGALETRQHYRDLISWYQAKIDRWKTRLDQCRAEIERADASLKQWFQSVSQAFASNPRDFNAAFVALQESRGTRLYIPSEVMCREDVTYNENGTYSYTAEGYDPAPGRQNLGDTLGPIGVIARWLLRTESMPLTLIFGMIGFGIFGSTISRFVRSQGSTTTQAMTNLGGLIINGASAAVVVFLGVQGGLAAFMVQSEKPNPNPYTLLLTCFIAAVFSEHIWDWARNRVKAQFAGGGTPNPPPPPGGAPPPPPPPAPPPT